MKGKGVVPLDGSGPSSGEGGGSWAQVVAGRGPVAEWSSSPLSVCEVEGLEAFFSKALVLPVGEIGEEKERWEGKAVIMRSLGRRVPPAWTGRDMRARLGLGVDPEVTPIAEDHFLVRFDEKVVCDRAIQEAPWVVGGQLLAMEPWRPAFVPARRPISKVVVWLRLPGLPMECWRPSFILAIAAEAGKPLSLDSFTEKQRRRGFARVKVEIDSGQPVKPGVVVEAGGERFWQQFQFENLPPVCFLCGLVGHVESGCDRRPPVREEGVGGEAVSVGPRMPRLGPWISTSRIRQPRVPPVGGSRWAGPTPGKGTSSGPSSSSPASNPRSSSSPPGSPSDSEGWQKPSKVARRGRVEVDGRALEGEGVPGLGRPAFREPSFAPLAETGEVMEEGTVASAPAECHMADLEQSVLKRPRSPKAKGKMRVPDGLVPSKPTSLDPSKSSGDLSALPGSSPGSSSGTFSGSAPPTEGQVLPFSNPCLAGAAVCGVEAVGGGKGEVGDTGGGLVLVPVEVGQHRGLRGAGQGACPGPELGVRGSGAVAALGGSGGVTEVGVGGQREGREALVLVGIREVEALGVGDFGGLSSVCLEGGEGMEGVCRGLAVGRGSGFRPAGKGGLGVRAGSGVVGSSRDRSRSPGGSGRVAGAVVGGPAGGFGRGGVEGSHAEVVAGVREAVRGAAVGSGKEGDSAGAPASCD